MKISNLDVNQKIGVAVSGGADSMVLLHLIKKSGKKLLAINIEHGIRGEESLEDSEFVASYCQQNNIKCLTYKVDAIEYSEREGVSVELSARLLRYQIFDELLSYGTVDAIALGHHQNDQAETVLMRLFRGTGVRGLRGIVDRKGYIHPLLEFSKKEIVGYAKANGIPYIEDFTNYDSQYTRNYIRQKVIPVVEERYPEVINSIYKMSKNLGEVEDYLLSEITAPIKVEGGYSLPITVLDRHPAIAKKSIAECLRIMGIERDIEHSHLDSIYGLKNCQNNAVINLPFEIDAAREYDKITFFAREDKKRFSAPFDIDKSYHFGGESYTFSKQENMERGTFDYDKLPKGVLIRTREAGDKFKPYGGGTKLLSDYLTDIKMPSRLRDNLLVIAGNNIVYAVLGVEISHHIKVSKTSKNIYKINKEKKC